MTTGYCPGHNAISRASCWLPVESRKWWDIYHLELCSGNHWCNCVQNGREWMKDDTCVREDMRKERKGEIKTKNRQ